MIKLMRNSCKLTTGLAIFLSVCFVFIGSVTYLAARETIAVAAPIALWLVFALAMIIALAIGLDRIQWFLLRRAEFRRDQSMAESAGRHAKIEAEAEYLDMVFRARMMNLALRQVSQGKLHAGNLGNVPMASFPTQVINQVTEALPEPSQHVWPKKLNLFDLLPSSNGNLDSIILGVDSQNSVVSTSLEDMVHCAFGGETGTGKSTLAYSMAYQIATAPQDIQMILADTAGTTWKTLKDCDRLMFPIISSDSDCLHVLNELHDITTQRTEETFNPYPTVEKLSEYNAVVKPDDRLGYIAMFIDEFPEYLENKDIETILRRLIRKSRKAGIYIFGMGTSWKHSDMDTSIKRQFRTKIHFGASDAISSRVLLGTDDASKIKQVGRAYAKLPFGMSDDNKPVQFQATHINKSEVMNRINKPTILDLPTSQTTRPDMAEQAVIDAHNNGIGHKECYRIFAKLEGLKIPKTTKQVGGSQTTKIKDILAKWGVNGV